MDYPSKRKLTSKRKLMSELSVNRMTMQKLEQKKPRATEPWVVEPDAKEKPLLVLSSTLPDDFFVEEALLALCTLGNNDEIKTRALLDTGATGYSFFNPAMARHVCDKLEIGPIRVSKPKAIQGFDGKQAPNVTHAIYPTMTVQDHREMTTPMLITKLGQHQIILGKHWMKKHGVILDMQNNWLSFWPGHYQHNVALRLPAAEPQAVKPRDEKLCVDPSHAGAQHTKKSNEESNVEAPHAKEPHVDKQMKILKRSTNEMPELLPYLLPSTRGVSKVVNTPEAKRKKTMKKKPSTLARKPKPNAKDEAKVKDKKKPSVERADSKPLDLAFIDGAPFIRLAKSKKPKQRAEIFAISMQDIEY